MAIAIMLSTFGCCNGLILAGSRVYYAMAKDGLFFKSVAKLHPTYKTPAVSLMVQMVWTCICVCPAATDNCSTTSFSLCWCFTSSPFLVYSCSPHPP